MEPEPGLDTQLWLQESLKFEAERSFCLKFSEKVKSLDFFLYLLGVPQIVLSVSK